MKKRFLMLFLFALFIMPMVVKADMGAPSFDYKVIVTNKDGAQNYEFKFNDEGEISSVKKVDGSFVKYDTVLSVDDEIEFNKVKYLSVTDTEKNAEGDYDYYLILDTDSDIYGKINPKDYEQTYESEHKVFKEGAYLYKGPSKKFGRVDDKYMLPVGAEFKVKYATELFAYVEYNGHKGWVYIYPYEFYSPYDEYSSVGDKITYEYKSFYTLGEQKLYTDIDRNNSESITVPDGTKIIPKLSYSYTAHFNAYLVEYDGKDYWFFDSEDTSKIKNDGNAYFVTFSDVKVFSDYGTYKNEFVPTKYTGKKIPKYTKVTFEYYYCTEYGDPCFYYINNKDYKGWVYNDYSVEVQYLVGDSMYTDEYTTTKDLVSYKSALKTGENDTKVTIPKGTKINVIETEIWSRNDKEDIPADFVYVTSKDYVGYIKYEDFQNAISEEPEAPVDEPKQLDPRSEPYPSKETRNNKVTKKTSNGKKKDNVILFSVILSGVVVLSGIVLIIYAYKKNKNKKLNSVEVNPVENTEEIVTESKPEKKSKKEKSNEKIDE